MPRPSKNRAQIRVRHTSGAEKLVHPSRAGSLGPHWAVVAQKPATRRRRPAVTADESTTTPPAVEPDDSQEG